MKATIFLGVAIALIGAGSFVHGIWSGRWGESDERHQAVACLADVPMTIGDWQGEALDTLDDRQQAIAQVDGILHRRYVNRAKGSSVSMLLVCGRTGPVAVHSPEVCYRGAGYEMATEPAVQRVALAGGATAEFRAATFVKPGAIARDRLRIFWAWSATGVWSAPHNPRLSFAAAPVLFKLYVVRALPPGDATESDPAIEFVQQLLPILKEKL